MKVKLNDNLRAIYTYIQSCDHEIDLNDFIQYCIDYEYYKELYQNWHIIRDIIKYHDDNLFLINQKRSLDNSD